MGVRWRETGMDGWVHRWVDRQTVSAAVSRKVITGKPGGLGWLMRITGWAKGSLKLPERGWED